MYSYMQMYIAYVCVNANAHVYVCYVYVHACAHAKVYKLQPTPLIHSRNLHPTLKPVSILTVFSSTVAVATMCLSLYMFVYVKIRRI